MATLTKSLYIAATALMLGACATNKEDVIPQDGPDMATIYQGHQRMSGASYDPSMQREGLGRPLAHGESDLRAYTQQASNEINQVFPILANPQLVVFVFPHLSVEGAPVPGYSTAIPMYESDQYALPGEVHQP